MVLTELRTATRGEHHALDHHPELNRLVRSDLTWTGYARSLAAMHLPHGALERAVRRSAVCLGTEAVLAPARLWRLEKDLQALGVRAPDTGTEAGGPLADTVPALIGLRYVLEGSRLGAEVLARCVRRALGPDAPMSFLQAPDTPLHWQQFSSQAAVACMDHAAVQQAVAAARQAFGNYLAALDAMAMRTASSGSAAYR